MGAQIESLVELFLTRGGRVFVSPQYDIPFSDQERDGGSCPDFVALDFARSEVVVVEVSSASNLRDLISRVRERETRWFAPIRRRLEADRVITSESGIRFLGFVREALVDGAKGRFANENDIQFFALEKAAFSFAYWTEREKGLPR